MAYPTYANCPYSGLNIQSDKPTLITKVESGVTKRKAKASYVTRTIQLVYNNRSSAEIALLDNHFKEVSGLVGEFWVILGHEPMSMTDEFMAQGDGETTSFNACFSLSGSRTVYIDGLPQSITFTSQGGADGLDLIVFATPPPLNCKITADYYGLPAFNCRYLEPIQVSYGMGLRKSAQVTLQTILNI